MSDYKPFPNSNSRQIIDYNRFMELTGEKIFMCLDRGVVGIAQYLLNTRGLFRSTYVKEYVGTVGYIMPTEEEFENITEAIAEANIDMASCNDIVEAINGIKTAIEAGSSGSGCGCVGSGSQDVTEINDAPSADIPPASEWESLGFASQEAYDSHRCNTAQYIVENYIQTLRNWSGLFGMVGGLTLAVITGLLLLTVPPAGLMLILAAMGVLVGVDIGLLSNLSEIADGLEAQVETLVCDLYNAASTGDAVEVIRSAAEAVIVGMDIGIMEPTFIQITDNLISNEQVAILFDPTASDGGAVGDCSACDGCPPFAETPVIDYGSGSYASGTLTISSVPIGGWSCGEGQLVMFHYTAGPFFRVNSIVATAGSLTKCGTDSIYWISESTTSVNDPPASSSDTGINPDSNIRWVQILSSTTFTLEIELCEELVP